MPTLIRIEPRSYLGDLRPRPGSNPYPNFSRLQGLDPDLWLTDRRWRGLVRYDDVRAALRDSRLSSAATSRAFRRFLFAQLPPETRAVVAPVVDTHQAMMIFADGNRHRRLRGAVQVGMTPHGVDHLRPAIERAVEELLDRVAPAGRADLIAELALPSPMFATAALLGLSPADAPAFSRWAADTFALAGTNGGLPAHSIRGRQSHDELCAYFERLNIERAARRDQPADLLDRILAAGRQGCPATRAGEAHESDGLDEMDRLAIFLSVLAGGYETATNLLGNGLLALLRHPDCLAAVRETDDPTLIDGAVEELARYDAPVQMAARGATENLEIGGKPIRRGEVVECWIGAANRDPDRFHDPDRLDLSRADNRHLAFGHGPHYCVGVALARLQARIAIPAVLRRLPDLRLAVAPDDLRWKPIVTFRALEALPVRFTAPPRRFGPGIRLADRAVPASAAR